MIYERGHVRVDSHFARFGSKSYAIDKINSVDVREEKKNGCAWIAFAFIAAIFGVMALGASASNTAGDAVVAWVLFAVVAGVAALLYTKRSKPVYHLMLATSSGEVQATNTGDRDAVMELRQAIETAMTERA